MKIGDFRVFFIEACVSYAPGTLAITPTLFLSHCGETDWNVLWCLDLEYWSHWTTTNQLVFN